MIGIEKADKGLLFSGDNFKVVKQIGRAGEQIDTHDHAGYNVIVTAVKGEIEATLNSSERHKLVSGTVLSFDGANTITPKFISDGEFTVTLIKK